MTNLDELKVILKNHKVQFNIDNLKNDVPLTDQKIDSLDIVEILLSIEEALNLKIPDEDASSLVTLEDYVKYINSNNQ